MFDKLKDLGGLMQQAQQMQQKMQELQDDARAAGDRRHARAPAWSRSRSTARTRRAGSRSTPRCSSRGQGRGRGPDRGRRQRRARQGRADRAGADEATSPAACRCRRASSSSLQAHVIAPMNGPEIERLIQLLGRLPGLGPRSARRVALHLLKKRETLMQPLSAALADAARAIRACSICGNLDTIDPCSICADPRRDRRPALRRRGCRRPVGDGARQDLLRPLSRAGRLAVGARRHRPGRAQHRQPGARVERRRRARGDHGHQCHRRRPDDGALPRRAPGRAATCR